MLVFCLGQYDSTFYNVVIVIPSFLRFFVLIVNHIFVSLFWKVLHENPVNGGNGMEIVFWKMFIENPVDFQILLRKILLISKSSFGKC